MQAGSQDTLLGLRRDYFNHPQLEGQERARHPRSRASSMCRAPVPSSPPATVEGVCCPRYR